MIDFINAGKVGGLQIGMRRIAVEDKLGEPTRWLGKPPSIGLVVESADDADVWFYYNNAVGVCFDKGDLAVQIHVVPSKIDATTEPFRGWPIGPRAKMSDFHNYLSSNNVPFREMNESLDNYYIIAARRCVALCLPFDAGKRLPKDDREIILIKTVASESYLPGAS